jgi:hypothetical protein
MTIEEILALAFGVALAVFVITRLNSGLSRRERERLTSTSAD